MALISSSMKGHRVTVGRRGITDEQAASVIQDELGDGYRVNPSGGLVEVRKGTFGRAKVEISDSPDGTEFHVTGQGLPVPLLMFTVKIINDRGIARHLAQLIAQSETFRAQP